MTTDEIGCCGACCGSCEELGTTCKGCTLGYSTGERDIRRARCQVKVCCIGREHATCADCEDFEDCPTLSRFHSKNGLKYRKYRQALDYIRANGYRDFMKVATNWTNVYGRFPESKSP